MHTHTIIRYFAKVTDIVTDRERHSLAGKELFIFSSFDLRYRISQWHCCSVSLTTEIRTCKKRYAVALNAMHTENRKLNTKEKNGENAKYDLE